MRLEGHNTSYDPLSSYQADKKTPIPKLINLLCLKRTLNCDLISQPIQAFLILGWS